MRRTQKLLIKLLRNMISSSSECEFARAVAKAFDVIKPELVQKGQVHIGRWCSIRSPHVHVPFQSAAGMTCEEYRHSLVVVQIRIAQRRAIENQSMVEQRTVGLRCLLQFVEEVRKHADMVLVDRRELGDPLLVFIVVRGAMKS